LQHLSSNFKKKKKKEFVRFSQIKKNNGIDIKKK
jgi:hypothetical protein